MSAKSQDARSGQHRRTRAALLGAAATLLRAGGLPSIAEAAEAADVSRRTAYRYFPTQEQLLTEAALETLRPGIEASFSNIVEPEARLEAAVRAMQEQTVANEHLLRTIIRLTVGRGATPAPEGAPRLRGSRRIDWIESAVAPVRPQLGKPAFAQLVSALSLCVGAEALIILRDVRNLETSAATDLCVWAARAILRAALAESKKHADMLPPQRRAVRKRKN